MIPRPRAPVWRAGNRQVDLWPMGRARARRCPHRRRARWLRSVRPDFGLAGNLPPSAARRYVLRSRASAAWSARPRGLGISARRPSFGPRSPRCRAPSVVVRWRPCRGSQRFHPSGHGFASRSRQRDRSSAAHSNLPHPPIPEAPLSTLRSSWTGPNRRGVRTHAPARLRKAGHTQGDRGTVQRHRIRVPRSGRRAGPHAGDQTQVQMAWVGGRPLNRGTPAIVRA